MTGKKVVGSKNDISKSCPEKLHFDNVYYIHNKSCIFSPGAPKNQNYDEKFYRHAHIV